MPGCYRVQHVKIQGTGDAVNGTAMIVSGMEYGDERKRTVDNVSKIGTVTSEIGRGSAL